MFSISWHPILNHCSNLKTIWHPPRCSTLKLCPNVPRCNLHERRSSSGAVLIWPRNKNQDKRIFTGRNAFSLTWFDIAFKNQYISIESWVGMTFRTCRGGASFKKSIYSFRRGFFSDLISFNRIKALLWILLTFLSGEFIVTSTLLWPKSSLGARSGCWWYLFCEPPHSNGLCFRNPACAGKAGSLVLPFNLIFYIVVVLWIKNCAHYAYKGFQYSIALHFIAN